jgi:hypothetical protein
MRFLTISVGAATLAGSFITVVGYILCFCGPRKECRQKCLQ